MHFTSADREEVMLALGKTIGELDRIADLDPRLEFMNIRRELVNAYLDVLQERLRPYDGEADRPAQDKLEQVRGEAYGRRGPPLSRGYET